MDPIQVNINISVSENTQKFLTWLIGQNKSIEPIKPVEKPAEAPRSTTSVTQAKPAEPAEPTKPVETQKQAQKPAEADAPKIDIETVRAALSKKVNDHRSEIKAKLTELGAPSVTKLDPSKYQEMYNFLNSL